MKDYLIMLLFAAICAVLGCLGLAYSYSNEAKPETGKSNSPIKLFRVAFVGVCMIPVFAWARIEYDNVYFIFLLNLLFQAAGALYTVGTTKRFNLATPYLTVIIPSIIVILILEILSIFPDILVLRYGMSAIFLSYLIIYNLRLLHINGELKLELHLEKITNIGFVFVSAIFVILSIFDKDNWVMSVYLAMPLLLCSIFLGMSQVKRQVYLDEDDLGF